MKELINEEVIRLSEILGDINETANRKKIAHDIALSVSKKFNVPLFQFGYEFGFILNDERLTYDINELIDLNN